jgi:hypothetical protein
MWVRSKLTTTATTDSATCQRGAYFVNSQGTMRTFGDKASTEPLSKDYVQTFYPNDLEVETSQPVHITAGGVKKLDLVLRDEAWRCRHLVLHLCDILSDTKGLWTDSYVLELINGLLEIDTYLGTHQLFPQEHFFKGLDAEFY